VDGKRLHGRSKNNSWKESVNRNSIELWIRNYQIAASDRINDNKGIEQDIEAVINDD